MPSWSRSPQERAVNFTQHTRRWIRWLRACSLPLTHIAELLAIDLGALEAEVLKPTEGRKLTDAQVLEIRRRRAAGESVIALARQNGVHRNTIYQSLRVVATGTTRPMPAPPRHRSRTGRPSIFAQNARHVRTLRALGYEAPAIARILGIELSYVKDFLIRIQPIRRGALVRPRSRAEQKAIRPPRPRPAAPPEIPADDLWRYRDDAPGEPPPAPIAAELLPVLEADQVELEEPPAPARNPWVGPTNLHGGTVKLTEEAAEIRRKHDSGWSVHELARDYCVSRNTIYRIIKDRAPLPCPDAGCPENGQ